MWYLYRRAGSFAAAAAFYYLNRYGGMRPKIVIVEPLEADAIFSSFVEGKVTTKRKCYHHHGRIELWYPITGAWDLLKAALTSLKIDDAFAREAMRELYYPVQGDQRVISGERDRRAGRVDGHCQGKGWKP